VPDITFKRGFAAGMLLYDWRQKVLDGDSNGAHRTGTITGRNAKGEPVIRFRFTNGWVRSWKGPPYNARTNEVAIEEVVIAHEGLERVNI
jgi:phage tail-like protein